jgi:hypothetical protein
LFAFQTLDLTEKSRSEKKETGGGLTNEQLCIIYAVCHVTGMMSACANPVIYGYLVKHLEFFLLATFYFYYYKYEICQLIRTKV